MKSLLDRSFRYTPSHATDISKTFSRIRREQEQAKKTLAAEEAALKGKVAQMGKRKA